MASERNNIIRKKTNVKIIEWHAREPGVREGTFFIYLIWLPDPTMEL